ncbi:hypothetical protein EXD82_04655 [Peptacetobacter hominis]|uniref:Uroporphyrinogen decarboxylase (URO-D) domain-containing protein n=1 Tax=Peptacetobacter hominis TaxID=2743610 RepID=A0A544QW52_9FIRM|nr:uroporphyrinogen decarboxylase family protein [Peptacetobacter hominis]TQQ84919.1 hypothetical protein EXD82_04655 [Peptacetobacter hominis]
MILNRCIKKDIEYTDDKIKNLFPKAYTDYRDMIKICIYESKRDKSGYCTIPISEMVFTEAIGGITDISYKDNTVKCSRYRYESIGEMLENISMDMDIKQLLETMKLCEKLLEENIDYIFNISGIMSVMDSMIDITKVLKATRKEADTLKILFNIIEKYMVEYIQKAFENGARIISYSDPPLMKDIIGPKRAVWIAENFTVDFIKKLLKIMPNDAVLHLCPKTVELLEYMDVIELENTDLIEKMYYSEAVKKMSESADIVAGMCINSRMTIKEINVVKLK